MGSPKRDYIESKILSIVKAGDQLWAIISIHIFYWFILQWYTLVKNFTFGGLKGYVIGKWISRAKFPPS